MDRTTAFTAWFKSQGGRLHPSVEFAWSAEHGYFMRVKQSQDPLSLRLPTGTTVVSCPHSLSLSALNALLEVPTSTPGPGRRGDDDGKVGVENQISGLPPEIAAQARPQVVSALWLCVQVLVGRESPWARYIELLPRAPHWSARLDVQTGDALEEQDDGVGVIDTPVWWTEAEKASVQGTNLAKGIDDLEKSWRVEWELWGSTFVSWATTVGLQKPDWMLFKWAVSIYGSRAFSSGVLSFVENVSTGQNVLQTYDPHALLYPGIDMLNHSNKTKNGWYCDEECFAIVCNDEPGPGEQVYNSYGMKDNGSLLLSFGFALPNNSSDAYALKLPRTKDPPFLDAIRECHARPQDEYQSLDRMLRFAASPNNPRFAGFPSVPREVIALNESETLLSHDPNNNVYYLRSPSELHTLSLYRSSKPNPGYPSPLETTHFNHLDGFPVAMLTNLAARLTNTREATLIAANAHDFQEDTLWSTIGELNQAALTVLLIGRLRVEIDRLKAISAIEPTFHSQNDSSTTVSFDLEAQTQASISTDQTETIETEDRQTMKALQIAGQLANKRRQNLKIYAQSQTKILMENFNLLRDRIVQSFGRSASGNRIEGGNKVDTASAGGMILTIPRAIDLLRFLDASGADDFVNGILTLREDEEDEDVERSGAEFALADYLRASRHGETEQDEEDILVLWVAAMFILGSGGSESTSELESDRQHMLQQYMKFWRQWYGLGVNDPSALATTAAGSNSNSNDVEDVEGIEAMASLLKDQVTKIKDKLSASPLWSNSIWSESPEFFTACVRIVREESVSVMLKKAEYEIFEDAEAGAESSGQTLNSIKASFDSRDDMIRIVGLYVPPSLR